jgi:Flp pilus assembly pilin Flp
MATRTLGFLDETGQTAVEYATVVALAAIVIALALAVIPNNLFASFWNTVQSAL